ncbi:MAG: ABC transporter ATP-binding protein [Candidatus Doudnabacteria bacterium]|nr:ABC transporter ATP-binding protein [Candidatus Doudnabacteria bacterium]
MFPYFRFLSQFWQKERGKIALIFLFVVCSQLFSLAEPFFFTRILDDFLRQIGNTARFPTEIVFFRQITTIVLIWIGVAFTARTFKNLQLYFVDTVADRIGIRIFEQALGHLLSLPMSFHASEKPGEIFRRLSKARDDITALFTVFFDKIFQNLFAITAVIAFIFWREWRLGLALVFYVPIFFGITYLFTKQIKRTQNDINQANEQLFGNALEAINNIELVKSFTAEEKELANVGHDNAISHQNLRKKTVAFQKLGFWQGTIVNAARVTLLWFGSILAFRGVVSFGDVILFTMYSFTVYQPLYDLGNIYSKYHEGINAVERLQKLLAEKSWPVSAPGLLAPQKLSGEIEFRNVNFSYEPGGRKILSGLSFRLAPGKKLAIVGLSGAGKSSVVKLLLRFYEPQTGTILIDGRDVTTYDAVALRRRIGLVLQDNVMFNTTILENARYGNFAASENQVARAVGSAHLSTLIEKLPLRLHTLVGERGLKLSGGEKQRLAIARALVKQPDIFIFDEATSSLDSHSEEAIKLAINEISSGVSTIVIAHRFATVVDADEIILLRAGKIIERGTHQELLVLRSEYAKLYNLQTQRQQAEEKELEEQEKEKVLA